MNNLWIQKRKTTWRSQLRGKNEFHFLRSANSQYLICDSNIPNLVYLTPQPAFLTVHNPNLGLYLPSVVATSPQTAYRDTNYFRYRSSR
ncbi:MAG: hypothetical protein QNJ47_28605 [Nostocaceae cyanobacterium]|nr:hypothetical protein [Nostocaceae cyanobacterium]